MQRVRFATGSWVLRVVVRERAWSLALAATPARSGPSRNAATVRQGLRSAPVLDLAIACDATPLAERARAELLIAGTRLRRRQLSGVDALTTNERRSPLSPRRAARTGRSPRRST